MFTPGYIPTKCRPIAFPQTQSPNCSRRADNDRPKSREETRPVRSANISTACGYAELRTTSSQSRLG